MTRYFTFFIITFLFLNLELRAQEILVPEEPSKISYSEKIYLQLSSKVFATDQIIWFKAIVTDVNQIPTITSQILHVELIDFDERIIDKKLLKLENGIADSFFELKEALPVGRYMIRAYTRWNKNFNSDLITRQYIDVYAPNRIVLEEEAIRDVVITEGANKQLTLSAKLFPKVINPKHKGGLTLYLDMDTKQDSIKLKRTKTGVYSFNYTLPDNIVKAKLNLKLDSIKLRNWDKGFVSTYSKSIAVDENYLDVQFFPEGGKLIDGLNSAVGFKVLDYNNKGLELSGSIVDETGLVLHTFKSNDLGMGIFHINSNANKVYYAEISRDNGVLYKYKLPKVYQKGSVISLKALKNSFNATIISNFSKTDSLFVKVHSRGVLYHNLNLKQKNGVVNVVVNRNTFPEGIVTFTVYNSKKEPICERLVFNYRENDRVEISLKTNFRHYNQREKTIVDLQAKHWGDLASKVSTSLLVINKKQLEEMHANNYNILSYFLLRSELKGEIENPKSYFDKNNKHRRNNMDALMLTQGWRNYIYKPSKEDFHFKIQPEKNLIISGSIGEYFNSKVNPKRPLALSLMTFGEEAHQVIVTPIDSSGRFKFIINDNYSKDLDFLLQITNRKGKKRHYTVNVDKPVTAPKVNYEREQKIQLADSFNVFVEENIKRKEIEKYFGVADGTIVLDEVNVKGYDFIPQRVAVVEAHGEPDVVIDNDELLSKIDWTSNLFKLLRMNYPDDIMVFNDAFLNYKGPRVVGADFTFVIVDGKPVEYQYYDLLNDLPAQEIESVEIIKKPKNSRRYVLDVFGTTLPRAYKEASDISFICIYSYANKGFFGIPHKKTKGIYKHTLPSFTPQREFYAPKYEDLISSDWSIPDLRSVVHWEPNLQLDENGTAKIEFYNSDNTGEMLVISESISEDGKIGYQETTYIVDEELER